MSFYRSKLTDKVFAPKNRKDFTKDWARRILVDYMCRTDPDWLLGDVLKVIDVTAKDNPHPGEKNCHAIVVFETRFLCSNLNSKTDIESYFFGTEDEFHTY